MNASKVITFGSRYYKQIVYEVKSVQILTSLETSGYQYTNPQGSLLLLKFQVLHILNRAWENPFGRSIICAL